MTKIDDLEYEILNEEFTEYDLSFKIIVVGDSGVGKSCLTIKATKNIYEDNYTPTVGFEFFTFNIRIGDKNIKLQIWDTCGQEAYRSLITSFYRNSSLAVLVYSIDNRITYDNIESWLNEIKSQANPEIKIFLIGNKTDLEDQRQITKEEAVKFGEDHSFNFFLETSAKTGFNAQNIFIRAAEELYMTHLDYRDRATRPSSMITVPSNNQYDMNANNFMIDDEDEKPRKKSKCC